MKKSNLILLGALATILIFTLAFQLTVHHYVKEDNKNRASIKRESEERKTLAFKSIKANGPLRIHLSQNNLQKVRVEAPNQILDSIKTSVVKDTLFIETLKNVRERDSVVIEVILPLLSYLQLGDKCHVESKGVISGEELYLELLEHSSAQLQLQFERMLYSNSSDGVVDITGETKNIKIISPKKE